MLLAMRGLRRVGTGREAAIFGLLFSAARFAVASHFLLALLSHSPLAIAFYALSILSILPWGLLEGWGAFRLEQRSGLPRTVGFGLLYTVGEWARTLGDLALPADLLAHAFGTGPAWLGLSGILGPFGVTLLVFAAAALANAAIETSRRARRTALLAAAVAVWLSPPAFDLLARSDRAPERASLRVGVVQPAIDVRDKLNRERWPVLWERLETLTREAAKGADLVVWPETTRPGPVIWRNPAPFRDPEMEALASRIGAPILYGCEIARVTADGETRIYNGAALARPDGTPSAWYGKQRLLPFVEGVPFAEWVGWDPARRKRAASEKKSILTLLGNFTPGPVPTIFEIGLARIGVLICYEGMHPSLGRAYRAAGANALVVLTNDAWWGRSLFPEWHARMVSARARELDLPALRAANNGISSVTDRLGRLRGASGLGETTTAVFDVSPGGPDGTLYARIGDLVIWLSLLVLAAASLRPSWTGSRIPGRGSPSPRWSPWNSSSVSTTSSSSRSSRGSSPRGSASARGSSASPSPSSPGSSSSSRSRGSSASPSRSSPYADSPSRGGT
jgi:apolipoprotein N-acyltransferase